MKRFVIALAGCAVAVLNLGTRADVATFSNGTSIAVPGSGTGNENPSAVANPYPSSITVSGMSGTITQVTVQLSSVTHQQPDDLDILLVGPAGQKLILWSDAGGDTSHAISGVNVTFDDAAASALPDSTTIATGTYKPTAYNSGFTKDNFPAPAPATSSPGDFAAPWGSASLASVFNGINPNGTWSLYVTDDKLGQVGNISGWSVTVTTASAIATTTTTLTSSSSSSFTGDSVTFTAAVTSGGNAVTAGTVTFKEGNATLAANVAVDGAGHATFATAALTEGTHTLTAVYNGTASFGTSSGSFTQEVTNHTVQTGNMFCNPGSVAIPDPADALGGSTAGSPGRPWPSKIFVSGLGGTISKVTVQLNGLSHGAPDDIDVLLVGPHGEQLVIFSDVGGDASHAVSGVNLTLDDSAANLLPDGGTIVSGTFRPTAVNSGTPADSFPSPAPAGPYNFAAPFGSATLTSTFGGADPNGTWSLYVADDKGGDTGSLAAGWCLTFTTTGDAATTTTVASDSPGNASFTGDAVTFTATVLKSSDSTPVTAGTVTFLEGATLLAGPTALNGSGQASFTTSALTEGVHPITAAYGGSPGAFNLSSGSVTQTVDNQTVVTGNTFCNPGGITIPATGTGSDNPASPAAPYPSRIFVSGLAGTIAAVTVTLNNLSHAFADDLDLLLVGPQGQQLVLLSDAGGANAVANVTLTLDDSAANLLPDATAFASGTYRPTAYNSGTAANFPAPAPSGPYAFAAPFGTATLASTFDCADPNGTWSLYVVDDKLGQVGSIAGGWCLNFTLNAPPTVGGPQTVCPGGTTSGLGGVGSGTWTVESGGTGAFNPNASTPNATFTHTGGSGPIVLRWTLTGACPTHADVIVTVNEPTTATALTALAICPGDPATFDTTASGTGPFIFVWRKGTTVLASGGKYTITSGVSTSSLVVADVQAGDTDTYSVKVTGACGTDTESAGLSVTSASVAGADTLGTTQDVSVAAPIVKLLANDSSPAAAPLSVSGVVNPTSAGGFVSLNGDSIVYTPPPGYSGPDSFVYTLSDGVSCSSQGTVSVTVTPASAPSANMISVSSTPQGFLLKFAGIPGRRYVFQYTPQLPATSWTTVPGQPAQGVLADGTGVVQFEDTSHSQSQAFYRTLLAP